MRKSDPLRGMARVTDGAAYREAKRRIAEAHASGARELSLQNLGLTALPEILSDLARLQSLKIGGNNLTELPGWIGDFADLRHLNFSENYLQNLPGSLANLKNIRTIDARNNRLISLPEWLIKNKYLEGLYIGGNYFNDLPSWLGEMGDIRYLDIGRVGLSKLPDWLQKLKNLRSLDVGGNRVNILPDWLREMIYLVSLEIRETGLTAFPNWIDRLDSLEILDLRGNKLRSLPVELGRLNSLEIAVQKNPDHKWLGLHIEDNPLPSPYPALIAVGQPEATANVLAYLRGKRDIAALEKESEADFRPKNEAAELPKEIIEQRPAAYRFDQRSGRIDALPERAKPFDPEIAADLLIELLDKARDLQERLSTANTDPRVRRSVDRLIEVLAAEPLRPGLVLSCSRSIEADRDAFDSPEGRAELFPDAIARMNDLLLATRDLLAVYPIVRQIERERLALDIERRYLEPVAENVAAVAIAAQLSDSVTSTAAAALRAQDEAIAEAPTQAVKADLIADAVLVTENFARAVVRATDHAVAEVSAGLPEENIVVVRQVVWAKITETAEFAGRRAGTELAEISGQCWQEVKKNLPAGVGDAARVAPLISFSALLLYILGPVAMLAGVIPSLKPLVAAVKSLKEGEKTSKKPASKTLLSTVADASQTSVKKRASRKSNNHSP